MAFGASWLPLSRTQLQGVKKLANQYSDRGVVVYWVSTEPDNNKAKNYASDEQLRAFSKKYGLTSPFSVIRTWWRPRNSASTNFLDRHSG